MGHLKNVFVAAVFIVTGICNSNAEELVPRILKLEPASYEVDNCTHFDTVPVKTFIKVKPATAAGFQEVKSVKNLQPA